MITEKLKAPDVQRCAGRGKADRVPAEVRPSAAPRKDRSQNNGGYVSETSTRNRSFDSVGPVSGTFLDSTSGPAMKRCASRVRAGFCSRTFTNIASMLLTDAGLQNNVSELIETVGKELEEGNAKPPLAALAQNLFRSVQPKLADSKDSAETTKWREFGRLLAESYDRLQRKRGVELAEAAKGRLIVDALKDQVAKLKAILKYTSAENKGLREELESLKTKTDNLSGENSTLRKEKTMLENEKTLTTRLVQQLNDKVKVIIPTMHHFASRS